MASAATASKPGAVADMNNAAVDVAGTLARLSEMTLFELRVEWRRLHRPPPPMRLSRDLLTRAIAYRLQEHAYGGLSKSTLRKLERLNLAASGAPKHAPPISLKAGARLVREWRGVTHAVLVHADGFEWNGRRYQSLTLVARAIHRGPLVGDRFSVGPFGTCFAKSFLVDWRCRQEVPSSSGIKCGLANTARFNMRSNVNLTLLPGGRALDRLAAALRGLDRTVIGRIEDGGLKLDLRCLTDEAAFLFTLSALDGHALA